MWAAKVTSQRFQVQPAAFHTQASFPPFATSLPLPTSGIITPKVLAGETFQLKALQERILIRELGTKSQSKQDRGFEKMVASV